MDKVDILLDSPGDVYFPLKKYDYILENVLNNKNRWDTKIVCSILDRDSSRYVSTTYIKRNDYLRLLETTAFLNCNNKLSPHIAKIYPEDKTIICHYIGEFLCDYLLNNPDTISLSLTSIFEYLKDVNSINQSQRIFTIPAIIKTSLQLAEDTTNDFNFLPRSKVILPNLESSNIQFTYGHGIEDPHIWNFRVVKTTDKIQALTTDFDFFTDNVNCFWSLGYLYATFRWFKKISFPLACRSEEILLFLIQRQDLKSELMFWLGVLSSYCGYRDSMYNFIRKKETAILHEQYQLIKQLDEKVSVLADRLLKEEDCFKYTIATRELTIN